MGRHKKEFTDEEIAQMEDMALHGCQTGTIAQYMGFDRQLLHGRKDILTKLTKKRAERKYELRKDQDEDGSTTMLIWRGKQYLGQTDKQEITGKGGGPLLPLQIVVKPERASDGLPIKDENKG